MRCFCDRYMHAFLSCWVKVSVMISDLHGLSMGSVLSLNTKCIWPPHQSIDLL